MHPDGHFQSFFRCETGVWSVHANDSHVIAIVHSTHLPKGRKKQNELTREGVNQLSSYFAAKKQTFDLPLDMSSGSEFQQKVWKLVEDIPFGCTCNYSEIAVRAGDGKAVRAVGAANAKNPFPIVIPCHRVIGRDGRLTGYMYGLHVKRWLLQHEGVLGRQSALFD